MAPLKQPNTLQELAISKSCDFLLLYASMYQKLEAYFYQFERPEKFISSKVPNMLRSSIFHSSIKRVSEFVGLERASEIANRLVKFLLNDEITELSLSDLIFVGAVSYNELDYFELGFGVVMPYMPRLTHLDLSTHKSEVTLPSCSYINLEAIGKNCPNLVVLNLNNNNRVTDDCLRCLKPKKRSGCPKLKEIYVQECSITDRSIIWLLKTFKLCKVGYSDMGTILKMYYKSGVKEFDRSRSRHRRRDYDDYYERTYYSHSDYNHGRRSRKYSYRSDDEPIVKLPILKLQYVDNCESTSMRSDRGIISLLSELCPDVEHVKVRICDDDSTELVKLKSLKKLELRFYTGVHHAIGHKTLDYLRNKGQFLSSLTLFCNELDSFHVSAVSASCINLTQLYLQCNNFTSTDNFNQDDNLLQKLQVLSVRIGQHEMDECYSAISLIRFFLLSCLKVEEIYLLLICKTINFEFFQNILSVNELSQLKIFIYDAPRRNRDLPVIPLSPNCAKFLIESCPLIDTIGNLISWQITQNDVCELLDFLRCNNFNVTLIYSPNNKINLKYF